MQKRNALYPVSLTALRAGRLMPGCLRGGAMITTTTVSSARAFRLRCPVIVAGGVLTRARPSRTVLRRRGRCLAATGGAAVFAG
jgi:hypothetical protein